MNTAATFLCILGQKLIIQIVSGFKSEFLNNLAVEVDLITKTDDKITKSKSPDCSELLHFNLI
ncbi:hypothetical protein MUB04_15470 [Acinetobacter indicus]|uniref:hypothetical protein n=1 Tax=Acinetobacter TaxID=469 RepID=UPI0015D2C73A|nr:MULTISPECIES: hypothetical protein [Acinetobacter]MCP0917936.1 hypothetical protein [Acinetobacter indicus]